MKPYSKLVVSLAMLFGSPAVVAAPTATEVAPVRRDAQELTPDALIGVWKLDTKGAVADGTGPRAQIRIFSHTAEGKLLANNVIFPAKGPPLTGHWAVKLDGSDGVEYTSEYGSIPFVVVNARKLDDHTLSVVSFRNGVKMQSGTFKVSSDGQTMTLDAEAGGKKSISTYRRWNVIDGISTTLAD